MCFPCLGCQKDANLQPYRYESDSESEEVENARPVTFQPHPEDALQMRVPIPSSPHASREPPSYSNSVPSRRPLPDSTNQSTNNAKIHHLHPRAGPISQSLPNRQRSVGSSNVMDAVAEHWRQSETGRDLLNLQHARSSGSQSSDGEAVNRRSSPVEIENYNHDLFEGQRQQALGSMRRVEMPSLPPSAVNDIKQAVLSVQTPSPPTEQRTLSSSSRMPMSRSITRFTLNEDALATIHEVEEENIPRRQFSGVDQNALSRRLSELALSDFVPTVMMRPPSTEEIDSALDTMVAQESRSRPRHGSIVTPEEAVLKMRARNFSEQASQHEQQHAAKWDPSIDHSHPQFNINMQGPLHEAPQNSPHDNGLENMPRIRNQRASIIAAYGPRASVMSDMWQELSIIEPETLGPQVRNNRESFIVPADVGFAEPGCTAGSETVPLSPRATPSWNQGTSRGSQRVIKCPRCNMSCHGFRIYRDHVCCDRCQDSFPSKKHYSAHINGPKHQAIIVGCDYCSLCNISAQPVGFSDHLASRSHRKKVQEWQVQNGEIYIHGGGNERFGAPRRIGGLYVPNSIRESPSGVFSRIFSNSRSASSMTIASSQSAQSTPALNNNLHGLMAAESSSSIASQNAGQISRRLSVASDLDSQPSQQLRQPPNSLHRRVRSDSSVYSLHGMPRSVSDTSVVRPSTQFLHRRPSARRFQPRPRRVPSQQMPIRESIGSYYSESMQSIPDDSVLLNVEGDTTLRPESSMSNMLQHPQAMHDDSEFLHVNSDMNPRPESPYSNLHRERTESIPDDSVLLKVEGDTTLQPQSSISNMGTQYSAISNAAARYPPSQNLGPDSLQDQEYGQRTTAVVSPLSFEFGGSEAFTARRPMAEQEVEAQPIIRVTEPLPSLGYGRDFTAYAPPNPRSATPPVAPMGELLKTPDRDRPRVTRPRSPRRPGDPPMGRLPHPPDENHPVVIRPQFSPLRPGDPPMGRLPTPPVRRRAESPRNISPMSEDEEYSIGHSIM